MKRLAAFLLVLVGISLWGQGLVPAPNTQMSPYAAERERAIAPALAALNRKDYANALALFEAVLPQYPHDARALMFTARSAHLAGDDKKAVGYLQTALHNEPPAHPQWNLHLEIVPLYAAVEDWEDFDRERKGIRDAATTDAPFFQSFTSYVIETIHDGDKTTQVLEFPKLNGRFHTRYRFLLPADAATPNWRPYIDCESDDIDQVSFAQKYPDRAAKGERSFSVDSYLKPNTHGTVMLFGDGEPTYETVRALVLKHAAPLSTTTRQ